MLFSIGHSNHSIAHFVALLKQHGIALVADVRSSPFSRFNPQFNRETLQRTLSEHDMGYLFLGAELGARSSDPSCYDGARVSYEKLAATPMFQDGLRTLVAAAETHDVAMMCAEKEPLECHRTILIARELERRSIAVIHILEDGTAESHASALARLQTKLKLDADLFCDDVERREQAYAAQAQRIAYVRKISAQP